MIINFQEKYDRINKLKFKQECIVIGSGDLLSIELPEQSRSITLYLNMLSNKVIIESHNIEGTYSYTSRQYTKSHINGLLYKVAKENLELNIEEGTIYSNILAKSL